MTYDKEHWKKHHREDLIYALSSALRVCSDHDIPSPTFTELSKPDGKYAEMVYDHVEMWELEDDEIFKVTDECIEGLQEFNNWKSDADVLEPTFAWYRDGSRDVYPGESLEILEREYNTYWYFMKRNYWANDENHSLQ